MVTLGALHLYARIADVLPAGQTRHVERLLIPVLVTVDVDRWRAGWLTRNAFVSTNVIEQRSARVGVQPVILKHGSQPVAGAALELILTVGYLSNKPCLDIIASAWPVWFARVAHASSV
jgi:hypothetical protein